MSRHQELVKLFHKLLHSDFFLKIKQSKTKQTKKKSHKKYKLQAICKQVEDYI